ncbi:MAG: hypothetical protein U1F11_05030 [Steroidobacteraceae bacterium]
MPDHALRPDALRQAIEQDRAAEARALRARRDDQHHGHHGARSDRGLRADRAQRKELWLHVDAALAGSAMILPECRPLRTASTAPRRWS